MVATPMMPDSVPARVPRSVWGWAVWMRECNSAPRSWPHRGSCRGGGGNRDECTSWAEHMHSAAHSGAHVLVLWNRLRVLWLWVRPGEWVMGDG